MLRSVPWFLSSILLISCGPTTNGTDVPAEDKGEMDQPFSAQACPAPLPAFETTVQNYRTMIQTMITAGEADERGKAAAWKVKIAEMTKEIEAVGKENMGAACWERYLELSQKADAPFEEPVQ